jgi:hypothetical protein
MSIQAIVSIETDYQEYLVRSDRKMSVMQPHQNLAIESDLQRYG